MKRRALVLALALVACALPNLFAETAIVPPGSAWKYLDDGSDQGTAWRTLLFDDSAWPTGLAQLGYGDGDEATTNSFGPDPNNKIITYYYRHVFVVPDAALYTNLMIKLLRDDGGIVYLNGVEIFRSNMPTGEVLHTTTALNVASAFFNETNYFERAISPALLQTGPNVLAVEIHQANLTSSDISFDLALVGNFFRPPTLVGFGAVWKYLDDGSDQSAIWREAGFDDSAWAQGPGQLGYGEGDEATTIHGGPADNRFITSYFRHEFVLDNPAAVTNLVLRLIRDDGALVYLNGTEILRCNMPEGAITSGTSAASIVDGIHETLILQTNVSPALLVAGTNLVAVEMHQVNNTSSDVSFDLELRQNNPPGPPEVAVQAPAHAEIFVAAPNRMATDVPVSGSASDFDGFVTQVEFFVNDTPVAVAMTPPYTGVATNLTAGLHMLTAVATDNSGLSSTSAPVGIIILPGPVTTTLVATGAVWKYLDDGSDPGPAWKESSFDDTPWKSGLAELGYGDAPTTIIEAGPDGSRFTTHYFRHHFTVPNAAQYTNLYFRVLRDDGVVAYLNGTEIFRMNMPTGEVLSATLASSAVGSTNESFYFPTNASAGPLVEGANVLAVELHQNSPGTSDASFDLSLVGLSSAIPDRSVRIARTEAGLAISWTASGTVLEEADDLGGTWRTLMPQPSSPFLVFPSGAAKFYRLR
jgi:hypothetical protein